ncbi:DUF4376 domain-containing protein [Kaistia sp. MMO-174]|uniref:DUF4376 domain-containing protein n=1 Tax=Kaistia sp. MMO-174 TaxID=3081256 RepID=UPI0030184B03
MILGATIVRVYPATRAFVELGSPEETVSPSTPGWTNGTYRIAEVVPAEEPPAGKIKTGTTYALVGGVPVQSFQTQDAPLEDLRAAKLDAIRDRTSLALQEGAPVPGGLHISLDDGARADVGSMATTAIAAAGGYVPWPESYIRGFIAIENIRIPMTTPADGLALASVVGDFYAQIRQHSRDLKDAAEAATSKTALAAIDETAGWPI